MVRLRPKYSMVLIYYNIARKARVGLGGKSLQLEKEEIPQKMGAAKRK